MINKEDIQHHLSVGLLHIEFTKKDGSHRTMQATTNRVLIESIIGVTEPKENKREKKENLDICAVFDIDAKSWRSFRWDNLLQCATK